MSEDSSIRIGAARMRCMSANQPLPQQLEAIVGQAGLITGEALAGSDAERLKFRQIRENFEPEQNKYGLIFGYDVSLPPDKMAEYVESVF